MIYLYSFALLKDKQDSRLGGFDKCHISVIFHIIRQTLMDIY